jgi:uncharacterized protein YuzE
MLLLTYSDDSAYLYFKLIGFDGVYDTPSFIVENIIPFPQINIDIDKKKVLLGIEVLDAHCYFPKEFLERGVAPGSAFDQERYDQIAKEQNIQFSHNPEKDEIYIRLKEFSANEVANNLKTTEKDEVDIQNVSLDVDKNNIALGIRILDAKKRLPKELLGSAE